MKKILFTLLLSFIWVVTHAQSFIAVPSYASVTNSFNASTGNIKFYLNGTTSQTLTVGHGANGVCFYSNNMFVAYADGSGSGNGILWYSNVSFANGSFSSSAPVILINSQETLQVYADASGNIYSANVNGTITKFSRNASEPYYSNASQSSVLFFSGGLTGGVFVDDATSTIWATDYNTSRLAVCKLSNFQASGVKLVAVSNNYINAPEGITKDNLGNIWVGNNNTQEVSRVNASLVSTIITEINANNYATKALVGGTDVDNFTVSAASHQLGGLVFDNLYSNKIFLNDQINGGNTSIYSFSPTNGTPVFASTSYTQIYPGNGQCAIIPCALLPVPIANDVTINAGQTANLVASNCATGTTYQWKDGATIVGTSVANFTTPVLNSNKTYTVACVNSALCTGTPTNLNVTVNVACTPPAVPSLSASPTGILIGNSSTLTATGCDSPNTLTWSNGLGTGTTKSVSPTVTTVYTASCSNGTCSSANGSVTVTLLSSFPSPVLVGYLHNWDDAGNGLPYMQLDEVPAAYYTVLKVI